MPASRPTFIALFLKITVYYFITGAILAGILIQAPSSHKFLPMGATERLFSIPASPGLLQGSSPDALHPAEGDGRSVEVMIFYYLFVFLMSILVVVPVAEVYRGTTRRKKGPSPATVRMILLLPVCVAGFVLIIQNSLVLAFSLAGLIAGAGVRFRTSVKDMSDTLYFMVATGIGMASGVGALGIAMMMATIFCYATLFIRSAEDDLVADDPAPEAKSKGDEG